MENDRLTQELRTLRRLGLPFGLQFSLFELLAILLFAGVGAAALRSGGTTALILVQAALWLFVGVALIALVARGSWQAFALGFVLGVAGYAIPPLYVGESELDPYEAELPLSGTLLPVWHAIMRNVYRETPTGEEFEADEVTRMLVDGSGNMAPFSGPEAASMGPYVTIQFITGDGRAVDQYEKPFRHEFMLVAHALLAIASGYVFSKIATVIYRRRTRTPQSTNS
jgi:hypothetical protein